jgi:hypothetical protein
MLASTTTWSLHTRQQRGHLAATINSAPGEEMIPTRAAVWSASSRCAAKSSSVHRLRQPQHAARELPRPMRGGRIDMTEQVLKYKKKDQETTRSSDQQETTCTALEELQAIDTTQMPPLLHLYRWN